MKSPVVKRSIVIAGHKTSVSLEDAFWSALGRMARAQQKSVAELIREIETKRPNGSNLSSAVRVAVLDHFIAELDAASPSQAPQASPLDRIRQSPK